MWCLDALAQRIKVRKQDSFGMGRSAKSAPVGAESPQSDLPCHVSAPGHDL
jgi:hypothetical protein